MYIALRNQPARFLSMDFRSKRGLFVLLMVGSLAICANGSCDLDGQWYDSSSSGDNEVFD